MDVYLAEFVGTMLLVPNLLPVFSRAVQPLPAGIRVLGTGLVLGGPTA